MKTKTKILLAGNVIALAAAYYAGVVVTRQEMSVSPAKAKAASAPVATVARTNMAQPMQESNAAPNEPSAGSAMSKLSPDELNALIQGNPMAAAYARGVAGDKNFAYTALDMARKWAVDDPRGALAWAQGLPTGAARNDSIELIFTLYGTKDPAGALSLAQSLPDDGSNVRTLALAGLANDAITLAVQDPAQAAAMLNTLGRNETNISGDNPTAMVATSWLMRDPTAATQWINTLPTGNTKDSAILAVVGVTGDSDPATAFSWLRTMSNPGKRGTTTTALVTQWAKKDPNAATAAVMQAYPNNNNGRQAALLGIIQQNTPAAQTNAQQ